MKRLAVMACYSPSGELEEHKKILIQTVNRYVDFMYVVFNGRITEETYSFLENTVKVCVRDNIGFDAGAYKDVLLNVNLNEYDELLLFNDTFYGFFYSLEEFISEAETADGVDFYGLTRHPKGKNGKGELFQEHIQSYFLFIKSRLLHSHDFSDFWRRMQYPETYTQAVMEFEVAFSEYFNQKKYVGKAYSDVAILGRKEEYNTNPTLKYPYELICDLKCPVLKRKSVAIGDTNVWKALQYIRDNHLYDFDLLWNQVMEDYRNHSNGAYFNLYELEGFLSKYSRIYIYGTGVYGKGMAEYLQFRGRIFEKYIVSTKENVTDVNVIEVSELKMDDNTGIILALKSRYTKEVLPVLLEKVQKEQLFLGNEDR